MQVEKSKKSRFLFEQYLLPQQIKSLIEEDQELLKKLLSYCGKVYQKQLKKNHMNYKSIMKLHSSQVANLFSVNICIHFALLCSQNLLKENRQIEGKNLLKETIEYVEIQGTDPMLIAVSFNNLAHLHYKQGKLYKALMVGLSGIEVLQNYILKMRLIQTRERIVQDVVVFVNIVNIVHKTLAKILKNRERQDLRVLFKKVNRLGYNYGLKYLGKDSIFTKKFTIPQESIILPLYQSVQFSEVHPFQGYPFELKLAGELQNIYNKLAELNLQPEVYYIRQNLIKSRQGIQSQIEISVLQQKQQPKEQPRQQLKQQLQSQPQYSLTYCNNFLINNEQMSISILKDFRDLTLPSHNFTDFLGQIEFKTIKNNKEKIERLHKDKFEKILTCMNINDVLPYELEIQRMKSDQFCRRVFINFIGISQNRSVEIRPHSSGLLEPFQTIFCKQKVLIFVNHVYFNKFRIAICPPSAYQTVYLNVYLNKMQNNIKLIEMQNQKIKGISTKYNRSNQNYSSYFKQTKKINILDLKKFKIKIQEIIKKFQQFVDEIESQMITQMSSFSHYSDEPPFFLYSEEGENKATFMQLKYRSNVNHIEIYLENIHQTHTLGGLAKAKGSSLYSPQHFLRDFSFGIKFARKNIQPFLNIIAQRYSLKIFNEPIEQHEEDRFDQNAIQQLQFNSKFYTRKFIEFENYMLPVTLELISLKNQRPMGIKVSAYDPIKSVQTGIFIYMIPQYWVNGHKIDRQQNNQVEVQNVERKPEDNIFEFQRNYFVTSWLKEEGFDLIFSKIVIVNRSLQLKGINRKFCSLEEII